MSGLKGAIASLAVGAALLCASLPALAQSTLNDALAKRQQSASGKPARLLVEARELIYNDDKNTISASGDVELNYQGRTLQADRVIYDRNTGRVHAEGNAHLTEANGTVTTGSRFELTDDFKTGFIDSLRVQQTVKDHGVTVKTRFAAPRAERVEGESTVFEKGTYTACEPCREHPERPPLWQVKAARIIHNNEERTIYYEDATVEFIGIPIAYVPYFWSPDPTVKRQTGFLAPRYIHSSALGTGAATPFFWAISPDKDLTLTPTYYSRQGALMEAEYRQRLMTGAFGIRAAGIFQEDKSAFLPAPYGAGNRTGRGSIETVGRFNINEHWTYGWDTAFVSDKWFFQNYKIKTDSLSSNYLLLESTSQIYLQGKGDRSFFDLRGYYFQGLSYADWQKQLPLVAPVLDYDKRVDGPEPLGGELRVQANLTSVHRDAAQFQPVYLGNQSYPFGANGAYTAAYESCLVFQRGLCLVRGLSGDYTRVTGEVSWRRAFIDDAGQVWTPFTYFKANGYYDNPNATQYQNAQIGNFFDTKQQFVGTAMPAVGLEYRFPFVADEGRFGTHTLTPIGQIIVRPNEGRIGRVPNEDAHSLVYDDTNLFDWDKFSGYDRTEGGVRANVGLQYNVTTPAGWTGNALFGQSYQLAGRNSYAMPDLINTGLESGLDTRVSDYVGRLQINPSQNYSFILRTRLDRSDFSPDSFEAQMVANLRPFVPFTGSLTYARYGAQPLLGYSHRREGLQPAAAFDLTPNWSIGASYLFDLDRYLDQRDAFATTYQTYLAQYGKSFADTNALYRRTDLFSVAQSSLTLGYKDECTTFSISYATTPLIAATGERETDKTVMVRLEFRTLGQTGISQSLGSGLATDGVASR